MNTVRLRALLYFPRRVVWLLLTFLAATSFLFIVTRGAASDPAQGLASEQRQALRQQLGLDQPVWKQYTSYLGGLLRGDFGISLRSRRPVIEEIGDRLPSTLRLLALSIPVSMGLSLLIMFMGWIMLRVRTVSPVVGAPLQRLGQIGVTAGLVMPVFLLGLLLLTLFALELNWLPALGWADVSSGHSFDPGHAVLPVLTLATLPACLVARSVLGEVVHYRIRVPGSRGPLLAHATLLFLGHGFIQAIGMLGGVLFVEVIFALPGIGRLFVSAIFARDLAPVLGLANLFLVLALLLRALADLVQGIDAFLLPKLEGKALGVPAQLSPDRPSYARTLAWAWIAICVLLVVVPFAQGLGGFLAGRDDALRADPANRNLPPGGESADGTTFAWGTDALGRDVRSRVRYAQGLSLGSSFLIALLVLIPALLGGLLTGYLATRRAIWADLVGDLLMFPVDVLTALPGLVLLAVVLFVLGPGLQVLLIWLGLAFLLPRCLRMVQSWWLAGPQDRSAWFRLAGIALGVLALGTGLAVVTQWAFGFLGLGVQPPQPDLGVMLAEGLQYARLAPHLVSRPGGAALSAAFGWFLLADTLLSRFSLFKREAWLELNR
jgi:ABC-type dipeptide/oligopeptide/nickel transport system permease component/ABC-type dipeptide/oligopeptide/nickel transport system permease subunit